MFNEAVSVLKRPSFLCGPFKKASAVLLSAALTLGCIGCGMGGGAAEHGPTLDGSAGFSPGTDVFEQGTVIAGVDVGGMERKAAAELLSPAADSAAGAYVCVLRIPGGETVTAASKDIRVDSGLESALDAAMAGGAGNYDIHPVFDEAALDEWLPAFAESLYSEPAPSELKVITDFELARTEGRFRLVPGADGRELDADALDALKEMMLGGQTEIEVPVKVLKFEDGPDADALPELLGAFVTEFGIWSESASNRAHNIGKAAKLINGIRTAPGESFSCSDALGERSAENGWKPATAFVNGGLETEEQYGGGICQISSTMYNAVLRSDLKVLERSGHSRAVPYVPGGTDAAISGDTLDFVWQNNTDSDAYIFMWVENKTELHCEIYGRRTSGDFDTIDVESVLIETMKAPAEPVFTSDPNLPGGTCELAEKAADGKVFETYKVYYKNGSEIRREYVDKTEYRERPAVYAVGTGK